MISQGLEDFLTYLRETEQQMHMAAQSEQEANDATQDILAMENLLGHGETRTKEGRERGQEWIMKRFCRIE